MNNFSSRAVCIIFQFERKGAAVLQIGELEYKVACREASKYVCDVSVACGYTTVIISSSQWSEMSLDPQGIARSCGLHVYSRSMEELFPSDILIKPYALLPLYVEKLAGAVVEGADYS